MDENERLYLDTTLLDAPLYQLPEQDASERLTLAEDLKAVAICLAEFQKLVDGYCKALNDAAHRLSTETLNRVATIQQQIDTLI